ncbi:metalloprotease TldD [Burkholderia glumae]|uniref:metallopeptidase TldD-related protein n=1 Tax=Burkholderia glumae TaxID=337 RepID=UPI000F5FF9A3|nr:metallopeptidase TldD-related protein [Burkholderia glumae]MCQ0033618.1 metallopeptidase TldD-related protein [Burkholderia glumae]MCQ0036405.1 metallopeptidase TldD-related protein [Burkholderia glumae]QJP70713.1 metalloprotease TldD [Burkholderia glumae]QJW82223.1 metalloprotease TldD [Burkholderia glumae]RQZ70889.1 metalloprotease TldD [Burkholderia glumae]
MSEAKQSGARLAARDGVSALAHGILLEQHGIDETALFSAMGSALGQRGDFADLFLKETTAESWSLEGGAVRGSSYRRDAGFGLRVLKGEEATLASSQRIDAAALRHVAARLRGTADGAPRHGATAAPRAQLPLARPLYEASHPLEAMGAADKIALLKRLDEAARAADSRVIEVHAVLSAVHEAVWVARCDGLSTGDVRPLLSLWINVRVRSGAREESASGGMGGRYGVRTWSDDELRAFVRERVSAALTKLQSQPAPAGKMTVVVGPGWNGVLLHEAVGHGLEADGVRRGTSAFAGRLGEQVASPHVTIVDDGTLQGGRGSLHIDDEGCETRRTTLIENGVLCGYMHDGLSARLMRAAPTGNGRREGYAASPMPRMTNTFMLNGDHDPGEIVESVRHGIYVSGLEGGQVDITSGQFVFEASEAYLIENGRIAAPLKGATITGRGPDTIRQISMVGNDLACDPGRASCSKAGQWIPVGVGQPTVRVDEMIVGGTA